MKIPHRCKRAAPLLLPIGIETESGNMPSVYSLGNYTKVDRRKALSDAEYFFNHRMELLSARFGGQINAKYGTSGVVVSSDVKFAGASEFDLIETDYHY